MDKKDVVQELKNYLESSAFSDLVRLRTPPLLAKEKEDMEKYETNWQSFVLSLLPKSAITDNNNLLIRHWMVKDLNQSKETRDYFCNDSGWTDNDKWCSDEKCWEKNQSEFDAVLKDKDGNWVAVFEYEDDYLSCCQELCSMVKLAEWLKPQQNFTPIFTLFYWLPNDLSTSYNQSKECLDKYVKFITSYMEKKIVDLEFLLVLLTGPDNPKFEITKCRVIDNKNFSNLDKMVKSMVQ